MSFFSNKRLTQEEKQYLIDFFFFLTKEYLFIFYKTFQELIYHNLFLKRKEEKNGEIFVTTHHYFPPLRSRVIRKRLVLEGEWIFALTIPAIVPFPAPILVAFAFPFPRAANFSYFRLARWGHNRAGCLRPRRRRVRVLRARAPAPEHRGRGLLAQRSHADRRRRKERRRREGVFSPQAPAAHPEAGPVERSRRYRVVLCMREEWRDDWCCCRRRQWRGQRHCLPLPLLWLRLLLLLLLLWLLWLWLWLLLLLLLDWWGGRLLVHKGKRVVHVAEGVVLVILFVLVAVVALELVCGGRVRAVELGELEQLVVVVLEEGVGVGGGGRGAVLVGDWDLVYGLHFRPRGREAEERLQTGGRRVVEVVGGVWPLELAFLAQFDDEWGVEKLEVVVLLPVVVPLFHLVKDGLVCLIYHFTIKRGL